MPNLHVPKQQGPVPNGHKISFWHQCQHLGLCWRTSPISLLQNCLNASASSAMRPLPGRQLSRRISKARERMWLRKYVFGPACFVVTFEALSAVHATVAPATSLSQRVNCLICDYFQSNLKFLPCRSYIPSRTSGCGLAGAHASWGACH